MERERETIELEDRSQETRITIDRPPIMYSLSADPFFKALFFNQTHQVLRLLENKLADTGEVSCYRLLESYEELIQQQNNIIAELFKIVKNTGDQLLIQSVHTSLLMICLRLNLPKLFKIIFEGIKHVDFRDDSIWQFYYLASYFKINEILSLLVEKKLLPPPGMIAVAQSCKCSEETIDVLWNSLIDSDKDLAIDKLLTRLYETTSPTSQYKMPTKTIQEYYEAHKFTGEKKHSKINTSFEDWIKNIRKEVDPTFTLNLKDLGKFIQENKFTQFFLKTKQLFEQGDTSFYAFIRDNMLEKEDKEETEKHSFKLLQLLISSDLEIVKFLFHDYSNKNSLSAMKKLFNFLQPQSHYDLATQFLAEHLMTNTKLSPEDRSDLRKMFYFIRYYLDNTVSEIQSIEIFKEDFLEIDFKSTSTRLKLLKATPETIHTLELPVQNKKKVADDLPGLEDILPRSIQTIILSCLDYLTDELDKKILDSFSSILPPNLTTQDQQVIRGKIKKLHKFIDNLTSFQQHGNTWRQRVNVPLNQKIRILLVVLLIILIIKLITIAIQNFSLIDEERHALLIDNAGILESCLEQKYDFQDDKCIAPTKSPILLRACAKLCKDYNHTSAASTGALASLGGIFLFCVAICCAADFGDICSPPTRSIPSCLLNSIDSFYRNSLQEIEPSVRNLHTVDLILGDIREKITFLETSLSDQEFNTQLTSASHSSPSDDEDVGHPTEKPTRWGNNQYTLLRRVQSPSVQTHQGGGLSFTSE